MPTDVASYTAVRLGPWGRVQEVSALYRRKRSQAAAQVAKTLAELATVDEAMTAMLGSALENRRILIVGPGQHSTEVLYWARHGNDVVGVDLDPAPEHASIGDYLRIWRSSGGIRLIKTLGRRLLGIEASYRRQITEQLPDAGTGRYEVLAMDAGDLALEDDTFDFVYSRSVFEHLTDPTAVMREIARVLKPGGIAYVGVHLYTSDGGCHDARIFAGNRQQLPLWSHLRPHYAERVRPNSYLNKVRLDEWRRSFREEWPGVSVSLHGSGSDTLQHELQAIRAGGELGEFADEELLNGSVVATWRRPTPG